MTARSTQPSSAPPSPRPAAPAGSSRPLPASGCGSGPSRSSWRWSSGSSCGPSWSRRSGFPSGSMENTLLIGDFLFVNKALYGAEVPLVQTRLPAVREPRAQRHPGLRLGRGGGAQGRQAADRDAGGHPGHGGGRALPQRQAGGRALRPARRSDPVGGSDAAGQDAAVAAPAPGRAGHGRAISPICRTGGRSSCRPTPSS